MNSIPERQLQQHCGDLDLVSNHRESSSHIGAFFDVRISDDKQEDEIKEAYLRLMQ